MRIVSDMLCGLREVAQHFKTQCTPHALVSTSCPHQAPHFRTFSCALSICFLPDLSHGLPGGGLPRWALPHRSSLLTQHASEKCPLNAPTCSVSFPFSFWKKKKTWTCLFFSLKYELSSSLYKHMEQSTATGCMQRSNQGSFHLFQHLKNHLITI